jgi:Circadian oscillating protein COP23
MLNRLPSIACALLLSQLCLTAPSVAVSKRLGVEFFCAPSQNDRLPTTQFIAPGMTEYVSLITWKYAAPKGMTNRQRCQIVSNKFQAAWDRGSFSKLVAAQDPDGLGLICAVSYSKDQCSRSNSLFTLNKFSDAQEVMDRLKKLMKGVKGAPLSQSSGPNSIDFEKFIQAVSGVKP